MSWLAPTGLTVALRARAAAWAAGRAGARRSRRERSCRRRRVSKAPRRSRRGAGERAALVPEQLALDQVGRDRAAVDDDEGPLARGRSRSWIASRDQLLARAGLALDQHGRAAERDALDRAEQLAHRRARAEQPPAAFAQRDRVHDWIVVGMKRDLAIAEGQHRAGERQVDAADPRALEERAVLGSQVTDLQPGRKDLDFDVIARDPPVVEHEVVGLRAADPDHAGADPLDQPFRWPGGDLDAPAFDAPRLSVDRGLRAVRRHDQP